MRVLGRAKDRWASRVESARFLAVVIALLASASLATAEPWQRDLVVLFQEVCAAPATPAAKIAAGENAATARGWKRDQAVSERAPFFIGTARWSEDKPFFVGKVWEFSPAPAIEAKFSILVAGPEFPDVTYTICGVSMPGSFVQELASDVDDVFGSALEVAPPSDPNSPVSRAWVLSPGARLGHCRESVILSSDSVPRHTGLLFVDMSFPAAWGPIAHSRFC